MKYILIFLVAILFYQCQIDELTGIHEDVVIIVEPEPLQVCDTVVTEPKFITIYNEYFNGYPDSLVFYFHAGQGNDIAYPTLEELLIGQGYHPDSIEVFQEGNSIAAIVRGTNDKSKIENKIWTWDGLPGIIGDECNSRFAAQKAIYTSSIQSFLFGGALTFEEYRRIAVELQSVRRFNFRNTNWTQEQYEEVALIILGECKLGREEANFMFNAFPISDELYCRFIERGWQLVRGQVPMCGDPFWINSKTLKT